MCTYVQTILKSQTRAKYSVIASRMMTSKVPLHMHAEWEKFIMKSQYHEELFHYLLRVDCWKISLSPKHHLLTTKDDTTLSNIRTGLAFSIVSLSARSSQHMNDAPIVPCYAMLGHTKAYLRTMYTAVSSSNLSAMKHLFLSFFSSAKWQLGMLCYITWVNITFIAITGLQQASNFTPSIWIIWSGYCLDVQRKMWCTLIQWSWEVEVHSWL